MFTHLLVPTDGSALSRQAVTQAIRFARDAGARVTFFCAEEDVPTLYAGLGAIFDSHTTSTYRDAATAAATDLLAECLRDASAAGVQADSLILACDAPWQGILVAARLHECDLIFMASHGRRGLAALTLGSETQDVLTHSPIPVLVYRSAPAAD